MANSILRTVGWLLALTSVSYADDLVKHLDTHPKIIVEYLKYDVEKSKIREAEVSWFPDINLTGNYLRQRTSLNNSINYDTKTNLTLSSEITLWSGYSYRDKVDKASLNANIAAMSIQIAKTNLWTSLSVAHVDYLTFKDILTAQNKALERLKIIKEAFLNKEQDGTTLQVQLDLINETIQNLEVQKAKTSLDTSNLKAKFKIESHSGPFPSFGYPTGTSESLIKTSRNRNPQVIRVDLAKHLLSFEQKEINAKRLPTLSAYTDISGEFSKFEDYTFERDSTSAEVGLRVRIPFYYDPKNMSAYETADQQRDVDLANVASLLSTNKEIIETYLEHKKYFETYKSEINKNIDIYKTRFDKKLKQYKEGEELQIGDLTSIVTDILSTYISLKYAQRELDSKTVIVWAAIGNFPK